jgi:hypothetical protein
LECGSKAAAFEVEDVPDFMAQIPGRSLDNVFSMRSAGLAERNKPGDCIDILTAPGMPKVPIKLKPEPEVRRHAEYSFKTEGCVWRHSPLATDYFVKPGK